MSDLTEDQIAKCKRVMSLIDTYADCPTAANRQAIRAELMSSVIGSKPTYLDMTVAQKERLLAEASIGWKAATLANWGMEDLYTRGYVDSYDAFVKGKL